MANCKKFIKNPKYKFCLQDSRSCAYYQILRSLTYSFSWVLTNDRIGSPTGSLLGRRHCPAKTELRCLRETISFLLTYVYFSFVLTMSQLRDGFVLLQVSDQVDSLKVHVLKCFTYTSYLTLYLMSYHDTSILKGLDSVTDVCRDYVVLLSRKLFVN